MKLIFGNVIYLLKFKLNIKEINGPHVEYGYEDEYGHSSPIGFGFGSGNGYSYGLSIDHGSGYGWGYLENNTNGIEVNNGLEKIKKLKKPKETIWKKKKKQIKYHV
jgi:hypothetical protein